MVAIPREGVYWAGAEVTLRQGVGFLFAIILARLLSPSDFGIIALISLFTGLAAVLSDAGLSAALIQRQHATHSDESCAFWFNLVAGTIASGALIVVAPILAKMYGAPQLEPLATAMAANVFLGALGSIHSTLLAKKLEFRTLFFVTLFATVASCVVATILAAKGFGAWALVAQALVMTSTSTISLWLLHRWKPLFQFDFVATRRLLRVGSYLMLSGLLDVIYNRVYTVFVGLSYGIRDLGFFNRADVARQGPLGLIGGVLNRLALPTFAKVAHDPEQLRTQMQAALRGTMLVCTPAMIGLAAVSDQFVTGLLGRGWEPVTPILQILCLGAVLWPLHQLNLYALMALGMSRLFFRLELANKVIGIGLMAAGSRYGLIGIAWGATAASVVSISINTRHTGRLLGYGGFQQFRDVLPILMISTLMGASVWLLGRIWNGTASVELAGLTAAGVMIYSFISIALGTTTLRDIRRLALPQPPNIVN